MAKYIYILCAKEEAKKNSYDNGYRVAYYTSLKKVKSDSENKLLMKELKRKESDAKGKINLYIVRYPVGLKRAIDTSREYKEWKRVGPGKWRSTKDIPISFQ
jgi:hypothetical protein